MTSPPDDIGSLLEQAARSFPDRPAFEHRTLRWTYAEVARRAASLAAILASRSVGADDVVAWIGDNTPAAALAYFGTAWVGAVLAPLHLRATEADLRRVLEHSGAKAVLVEARLLDRVAGLGLPAVVLDAPPPSPAPPLAPRAPRLPTDAAHLYYTSGSTGLPKGVILTHGNVTAHARLAARAVELSRDDVWLHAAPMFHLADAWATFAVTLVGGRHRFVERFDEGAVLDAFESGVTVTNLVPTMWNALVRHPSAIGRDYRSLRLLLSGGSAITPTLVSRVRSTFAAEYAQTYGLTETSPYLTISRLAGDERALPDAQACLLLARTGMPMAGVDVRVVDAAGRPIEPDGAAVGEVVARGPTVTPGYLRHPTADAAAFRDGWFRTGDLARVHPDGRIDLADRTGDVVNSGGEKVFTTDVERALADLGGIREVSVVGTSDAHWGQVVTAVVVADGDEVTLEAVRAHARERLADFKVPRRLVRLDALPRTASGKISKKEVRAAAEEAIRRSASP